MFSVFGPAASAAGTGLLIGLLIAAGIAYCNAMASAQLAAAYPTSGGTYVYGRECLGHWWGFIAGWGFVVGKTASCAAMALTFAYYVTPGSQWTQRAVAVTCTAGLTALNYRGVAKTVMLIRVLVATSLAALTVVVMSLAFGGHASLENLGGWSELGSGGPYGILQAAGLLFFAFAGYARVATMGEEVRNPRRTIPRAITMALFITMAIYLVVAIAALLAAGPDRLAVATAPLTTALDAAGASAVAPIVRIGAAFATLGALLSLMAGIGRTSLAMARHRDLPGWLAAVHPRYSVPHHAEVAVGIAVSALVVTVDLREVIGFSSFGVLTYYAIANAAAFTQPVHQRRWPRWLNVIGVLGCVALMVTLPWQAVVGGVVVFAVGITGRWIIRRR